MRNALLRRKSDVLEGAATTFPDGTGERLVELLGR
jgi:hypothetical protein